MRLGWKRWTLLIVLEGALISCFIYGMFFKPHVHCHIEAECTAVEVIG